MLSTAAGSLVVIRRTRGSTDSRASSGSRASTVRQAPSVDQVATGESVTVDCANLSARTA
jgi:hypothetical protein